MYLNEQLVGENTSYRDLFRYVFDKNARIIISENYLKIDDSLLMKELSSVFTQKYNAFIADSTSASSECKITLLVDGSLVNGLCTIKRDASDHIILTVSAVSAKTCEGLIPISEVPYPIAIIQKNGQIVESNYPFISYFGERKLIVHPLFIQDIIKTNVLSPESFDYEKMILTEANSRAVLCHFKAGESNHTFLLNLSPLNYAGQKSFVATLKDLTEFVNVQKDLHNQNEELKNKVQKEFEINKSYELELLKKNRLESLGELASGIFHELNQPLANLSLKIDNLFEKWQSGLIDEAYLFQKTEQIQGQIIRMRGIIDEMKAFSSVVEARDQLVSVKAVLNNALENVSYLNVDGLTISIDQTHDSYVLASPIELEQVFINLFTNSIQSLQIKQAIKTKKSAKLNVTVEQNDTVIKISIADNGVGCSKAALDKIFKAFYTTKKEIGGTGLGLFIINNLMRKMNGTISVDSEEGAFFKVVLTFPKQEKAQEDKIITKNNNI